MLVVNQFFTSPSMLCATCGGGKVVLNFLMLCTFFSQIASLAFSQYLVFVLTGDKKFERWARSAHMLLLCVSFLFSPKLLQLHFPDIYLRNIILFLCSPVTRSLNAELGLLLPSTRQYLRCNLSMWKYFKLFLSWSCKINWLVYSRLRVICDSKEKVKGLYHVPVSPVSSLPR